MATGTQAITLVTEDRPIHRFRADRGPRDLRQISEPSMSRRCDRPATTHGFSGSFDAVVLPHLGAAYRLARWLMRDGHDAEDVVQEASLRAFRYFRTFNGGDARVWFLRIVRNTGYDWRRQGWHAATDVFNEEQHSSARPQSDPETLLLQTDNATSIARALSSLPDRLHQLLVLRELEGLSYRELADVTGIPIGTVMSRLSRAREALRGRLRAAPTNVNRGESRDCFTFACKKEIA
jgi:RNA polymerase sigma-70 factor (ECF subfamily)